MAYNAARAGHNLQTGFGQGAGRVWIWCRKGAASGTGEGAGGGAEKADRGAGRGEDRGVPCAWSFIWGWLLNVCGQGTSVSQLLGTEKDLCKRKI